MLECDVLPLVLNHFTTWSILAILVALLYQWWKPAHPNFPPGYRGFPFLGIVPYLGKNPERVFKQWSLQLNKPMISVRLGSRNAIALNSLESMQEVLVNESIKTAGRPDLYSFTQLSKQNGMAFANFSEAYKKQRTFALTHLKKGFGAGTAAVENSVNEEISCFIKYLRNLSQGPVCVNECLSTYALNVVWKVIANKHFDYNGAAGSKFAQLLAEVFGESEDAHEIVTINLFPAAKYIPPYKGVWERTRMKNKMLLEDFVDPVIEEHKANLDHDNLKDYIDLFLYEQEFGKDKDMFTDEQLRHCALHLAAGGTESSSVGMSWAILCWIHYPEYQDLVQQEIDTVLGKDGIPTMSMRGRMPMTCAFLYEVLRFRTPLNMMFREAVKPVSAMGYYIPAGTLIVANLWGVHNDTEAWDSPEKFNPKRHINESGDFVPSNNVIPFCVGYRRCLGENIARAEQLLTFTKLLQNFVITPCAEKLPEINKAHNNLVHSPLRYNVNLTPR